MARLSTKDECQEQLDAERSLSAHIPSSEAGVCVERECGAVFNALHNEACPACGCRQAVLLVSWVELLHVAIKETDRPGKRPRTP